MIKIKFIEADQDWTRETTTYWFELTGADPGTGYVFTGEQYGYVDGETTHSRWLNGDGYPLTPGDAETIAVENAIDRIDDKLRQEASGLYTLHEEDLQKPLFGLAIRKRGPTNEL